MFSCHLPQKPLGLHIEVRGVAKLTRPALPCQVICLHLGLWRSEPGPEHWASEGCDVYSAPPGPFLTLHLQEPEREMDGPSPPAACTRWGMEGGDVHPSLTSSVVHLGFITS